MDSIGYDVVVKRLRGMLDESSEAAKGFYDRYVEPHSADYLARARWAASPQKVPLPFHPTSNFYILLVELMRSAADATEGASRPLPPVTAALLTLNVASYFKPGGWYLRDVALVPFLVLDQRQYYRLASSAFVHVSAEHLLSNMSGLLSYGAPAERRQGSRRYAATVAVLAALAHGLVVAGQALALRISRAGRSGRGGVGNGSGGKSTSTSVAAAAAASAGYYSTGAVGFSAVAFGLQVLDGYACDRQAIAFGCSVPSRYSCWVGFAMSASLVPSASMAGHAAGIAAGLVLVFVPKAVRDAAAYVNELKWRRRGRVQGGRRLGDGSSGAFGGISSLPWGAASPTAPPRRPTFSFLTGGGGGSGQGPQWSDLGMHAVCAGLAVMASFLARRALHSAGRAWS